jgi:chromosome segregation ATPase
MMTPSSGSGSILGKRRNAYSESEIQRDSEGFSLDSISSTTHDNKFRRLSSDENIENSAKPDMFTKYLESQILSLRIEAQLSNERRDKEINHLQGIIGLISQENSRLHQEKNSLMEENKILKKAVQLLDSKLKDSQSQNDQIQEIISKAVAHIEEIELENRRLNYELNLSNKGYGQSFFDQTPPDVY